MVRRRSFLGLLGAGAASFVAAPPAAATVSRALSLRELVQASRSALSVLPLAAEAEWRVVGGSRRIVTHTRVRVEELVAGAAPEAAELLIQTLGGRVGTIGQLVHGEAELRIGEPALLFVRDLGDGLHSVTAMAQGHYPVVSGAGGRVLERSPGLGKLIGARDAAVDKLPGRSFADAVRLVREAARR